MAEQDGSQSPQTTVPPAALQAIAAIDQSDLLRELVRLTKMQTPAGTVPSFTFTATTVEQRIKLRPPWFSIHILHDGSAGTLLLHINDRSSDPVEVRVGEDIDLDFHSPKIEALYVRADTGTIPFRALGVR